MEVAENVIIQYSLSFKSYLSVQEKSFLVFSGPTFVRVLVEGLFCISGI